MNIDRVCPAERWQTSATAKFNGHYYCECFCDAPLATCLERAAARELDIPPADIERWWWASRRDLSTATTIVDMTMPVEQNVEAITATASFV